MTFQAVIEVLSNTRIIFIKRRAEKDIKEPAILGHKDKKQKLTVENRGVEPLTFPMTIGTLKPRS